MNGSSYNSFCGILFDVYIDDTTLNIVIFLTWSNLGVCFFFLFSEIYTINPAVAPLQI